VVHLTNPAEEIAANQRLNGMEAVNAHAPELPKSWGRLFARGWRWRNSIKIECAAGRYFSV
jgi:hypothetical protein